MILVTIFNCKRQKKSIADFIFAQQQNQQNDKIKEIHVLGDELPNEIKYLSKVKFSAFDDKPRFKVMLQYVSKIWKEDEIYAAINPCIYFDSSISLIDAIYWKNKVVVLSKWQKGNVPYLGWKHIDCEIPRWNTWTEHDVWLFKDSPKQELIGMADERIDLDGFSGRIAGHLIAAKYDVANYTYDIRTYQNSYNNEKPTLRPTPKEYTDKYGYILPSPIWQWENPQTDENDE